MSETTELAGRRVLQEPGEREAIERAYFEGGRCGRQVRPSRLDEMADPGERPSLHVVGGDVATVRLSRGAHAPEDRAVCLMEAVAAFAGEAHSDSPQTVCPVLREFGRAWNDVLDDELRQRLRPFIPRLVGTADPNPRRRRSAVTRRSTMASDWLLATAVPAWLRLAGQDDLAAEVEAGAYLSDRDAALGVRRTLASSVRESRRALRELRDIGRAGHDAVAWARARQIAQSVACNAVATSGVRAAVAAARERGPSPFVDVALECVDAAELAAEVVAVAAVARAQPLAVAVAPVAALPLAAGAEDDHHATAVPETPRSEVSLWHEIAWTPLEPTTTALVRSAFRLLGSMIEVSDRSASHGGCATVR